MQIVCLLLRLHVKSISINFRVIINGVKPFEPDEHTNTFLERHKPCDVDHVPAPRRRPTQAPLLLDDDDAMSQDEDYEDYDDYDYDYDDEETEYIGKSSIF